MLTTKNKFKKNRHITGRGFVDSMSNALKNISSYVTSNKDLIAKPLLGAVGSLAATSLTAGIPALISQIKNRKRKHTDDPKYKEIIQGLMTPQPVTNIIGSGIKRF
jgi:hypothetical protein